MWTPPSHVRPVAVGVIVDDGSIFVFEGRDESKPETFFRPLGGTIEFGERGEEALRREFREEIGAEIEVVRYLGALENLFTFGGLPGHEIVLVYEVKFADRRFYERRDFTGRQEDGEAFPVLWKPLAGFGEGREPLYPDGLLELLGEVGSRLPAGELSGW